jgi:predicted PurR-regulated permease PerM
MAMPPPLLRLAAFVLVVGCLYWAQIVLIPVAMALLFTFLLAPVVVWLQRRHVPRAVAILGVVLLALGIVGGLGYVVVRQVLSLSAELPSYESNIKEKIRDIRGLGRTSGIERAQQTVARAASEADREAARETSRDNSRGAAARPQPPLPVVIQPDVTTRLTDLPTRLAPWLDPLSRASLIVLLVPFMLLAREELRNRLIRLVGFGRLAMTTRAMDEAGERVTHYLLTQSSVNATFGGLVAGGLYVLGLPYAVLFGFLAGALRFVPYVGIWIGAALPVAVGLAQFPGWTKALLVVGLFAVLEALTASVLEVMLYSRSAGVSQVGLLVALAFWTWIWGPIGLVLATPVTVCLVVFAKYVPELEFLWVLMGDEPAISPQVAVYQRLLAEDEDEASDLVERALAEQPREVVYDSIVVPSLARAGRDHALGRIDANERRGVVRAVRDLLEELAPADAGPSAPPAHAVFGAPARGETDALGLAMLRDVLAPIGIALEVASPTLLSAELVREARAREGGVVVVGVLPPGGLAQARYLCKRLRAEVPGVRIVVGRWGATEDHEAARQALLAAGAEAIGTSLVETRDLVTRLAALQPEVAPGQVA